MNCLETAREEVDRATATRFLVPSLSELGP